MPSLVELYAKLFGPATQKIHTTAPALNCSYGVLYIKDLPTPGGTALLPVLQRAYFLSKPLSRIDYDRDSASGQCFISLIDVGK